MGVRLSACSITASFYGEAARWRGSIAGSPVIRIRHRCGSKLPNDLGLFDMLGNVQEWCHDRHPDPDSVINDEIISERITVQGRHIRSAGLGANPSTLRSAGRGWFIPSGKKNELGFRPARTLP